MTSSRTMALARRTSLAALLAAGTALVAGPRPAVAQAVATTAVAAPTTLLNVGDVAPDFALPAATRYGRLMGPVRLADLKGQTIVIAFFYKARTKG